MTPTSAKSFGVAAVPARLALERGRWAEAATLELPPTISEAGWKRFPQAEAINAFARALGAARSGDAAGARREIERLNKLQQVLTERKLAYWAEQTEIQAQVATAWALYAEGKHEEALAAMRAAADHEDQTEKHVVVPGPILPARELLGDMLMELGQPAERCRSMRLRSPRSRTASAASTVRASRPNAPATRRGRGRISRRSSWSPRHPMARGRS